jgi:hypothetical protein
MHIYESTHIRTKTFVNVHIWMMHIHKLNNSIMTSSVYMFFLKCTFVEVVNVYAHIRKRAYTKDAIMEVAIFRISIIHICAFTEAIICLCVVCICAYMEGTYMEES